MRLLPGNTAPAALSMDGEAPNQSEDGVFDVTQAAAKLG